MKTLNVRTSAIKKFAVLSGAALLSACATTYKADPSLVSKFKPDSTPQADQTYVYVIRGSNFQGAARGLWIANNDKVVADLSNGSHTLLKLESGLNTVHLVQGLAGFGFTPVDNQSGKTVYLAVDYTQGGLKPVSEDLGISMVMQTKHAKDLDAPRKNDAYDNMLVNPSALGFPVMKKAQQAIKADAESAVISFYRMETLIGQVPFDIWSENGYVGSTKGGEYFQVRVKPGKHTFIALSERYSVLEADVQAGKEYVVEFDVDMGWNQAHVQLLPTDVKAQAKNIAKWQNKAVLMALDTAETAKPEFAQRAEQAMTFLKTQFEKVKAGELNSRKLNEQSAIAP